MSVAVTLTLSDGLIVGVDSAVTISFGPGKTNVYDNAEKIFQLGQQSQISKDVAGALGDLGRCDCLFHVSRQLNAAGSTPTRAPNQSSRGLHAASRILAHHLRQNAEDCACRVRQLFRQPQCIKQDHHPGPREPEDE